MNILLLETRQLSYDSSSVFMEQLKNGFLKQGDEVSHFVVTDIEKNEQLLEDILKNAPKMGYDFIFDINSILPLIYEDDEPYLDLFDIPFVNYIVDHPVHQAHVLGEKLSNFNLICLDESHCRYIKKCYPYIKNTIAMPLAGTPSVQGIIHEHNDIPLVERKFDILFPATYTPLSYYENILNDKGEDYLELAKHCVEIILNGGLFDIADIRETLTKESGKAFTQTCRLPDVSRYIDKYVREYLRQYVVEALLSVGLSLDVIGERWEMYEGRYKERLHIHNSGRYTYILDVIRNSKAVLNVQPLFKYAPHDRIFNAMVNKTAAITDQAIGLLSEYCPGRDYINFEYTNIQSDLDKIKEVYFGNEGDERLFEICKSAYEKAERYDLWENRCKKIKEFVKNMV